MSTYTALGRGNQSISLLYTRLFHFVFLKSYQLFTIFSAFSTRPFHLFIFSSPFQIISRILQ
ncbi:hypothetical protein E2C01_045292 [Portunus trituberculatus]|uniref:Uncharacterized protein n=1 Tax=Portunus trituberculatus TaxID=210409 RepID=A0A5B7G1M7_PORTR|nr:hypothetical protein [Portunus trituberculatus]